MKINIKDNFANTASLIHTFISNPQNIHTLNTIITLIAEKHKNGYKGLICGNGGSACDAMHYAQELTGRFRNDRKPLPAISLTDPSHITCVANDYSFDQIFARGVEAYGNRGDYLIAISTSGNSKNVINAVKTAHSMGILTIGLLGKSGGELKDLTDHNFIINAETSDRIQELHIIIIHTIIEGIERILFEENYTK